MTSEDRIIAHAPRLSRRSALLAGGAGLSVAALGIAGRHTLGAQEATPVATDAAFPPEEQLLFETIVDSSLAETATPGALVGIWYPERGTWLKAAGIGDVTTAMPVTLDDHVRIASNTKTFVATVILQLIDDGQLHLDDALESLIPGVPNGTQITLRQVLGMSAGISDFVNDPVIAVDSEADPLLSFSPDDALDIILASTPDFAPGERVQYSNSNYILLGMIVERVTGQPFGTVIQERILDPLGMTETSVPTTPNLPEPFVRGYDQGEPGEELRDVTRSNPDIPWASGSMISTLADLGTWAEALATGTLLSPELQMERLRIGSMVDGPVSVGYGLGILSLNGLIGHNGGIRGYSSWVMHEPASGASIVVVTNRGGNDGGTSDPIFFGIASHLFPGVFARHPAATPPAG